MFIVVQFIIGKNWNSSKCPLIEKYIFIHQMQYNSEMAQVKTRVTSTGHASILLLHRELPTTALHRRTKKQELMLNNLAINSLWPHELYRPWNSAGQNTEVGSRSLLQRIFPTQESNPGLPHRRQILYQLSHQGSPGNQQSQIIWIQIPALNSVWPWGSWWSPWSLVSLSIKCGCY